jgi:hypothetical protein
MEQEFSVLENNIVGRNMFIQRKVKDVKAIDVAGPFRHERKPVYQI